MGFKSLASVLLIGIMLTGCGGGGGGGDKKSDSRSSGDTAVSPAAVPVSTTSPTGASACATNMNTILGQLLNQTNAVRQSQGLSSLRFSYQLGQAAQNHATDMATYNYFSHVGRNGSKLVDRINQTGYEYTALGENLAAGYDTPKAVVEGWLNSPSHRENLLNPSYNEIGFGVFFNESSRYGSYWVQEFGRSTKGGLVDARPYVPNNCSLGKLAGYTETAVKGVNWRANNDLSNLPSGDHQPVPAPNAIFAIGGLMVKVGLKKLRKQREE